MKRHSPSTGEVQMPLPAGALSAEDLLETIPCAVFTFDDDGLLVRQNAAARALLVVDVGNALRLTDLPRVLGIKLDDIATTPCSWASSPIRMALEEGVASACSADAIKDGQRRRLEVFAKPLAATGHTGMLVVVRDSTEPARQHEERAAGSRMRAVTSIAGRLASEMKSALQRIKVSADAIGERGLVDDVTIRELKRVHKVTKNGTDLADKMLAYARRSELKPVHIDVKAQLRALERLLVALAGPSVRLALDLRLDGPLRVLIDPHAFEQVLVELFQNAREAMHSGGTLSFSLSKETVEEPQPLQGATRIPPGTYACITLKDSGPGMSEANLSRVFDPFFTTGPQGDGAGLGLPMVYGLVKQSGGFIAFTSKVGEGTCVRIWLPVDGGEAPIHALPDATNARLRPILIIHEDASIRRVISATLESHGRTTVDLPSFRDVKHLLKEILHQDLTVIFSTESALAKHDLDVAFAPFDTRIDLIMIHDPDDGPAEARTHVKGMSKTLFMPLTPHLLLDAVRDVESATLPDQVERFS